MTSIAVGLTAAQVANEVRNALVAQTVTQVTLEPGQPIDLVVQVDPEVATSVEELRMLPVGTVAKVPLGGRFIVATGDAEVEVKGTRFEVAVVPDPSACAPFARTQVMVQEGVVVVRFAGGEVRLPAGSVWPACPPPLPPPAHHAHNRAQLQPALAPTVDRAEATAPAPDLSTLAEQNDLFAAALSARRRGDVDEAIHWLDRLIARYPKGQLIDSARSERQRLIQVRGERARSE